MNIFQNKTNKYYKLKIYLDNLCRSSKYSYSKVMRINSSTDRTTVWLDKVRWTMTDNKDIRILLAEDNVVNSKLAEKMIDLLDPNKNLIAHLQRFLLLKELHFLLLDKFDLQA